jgi:predicted phage-related endonuclease
MPALTKEQLAERRRHLGSSDAPAVILDAAHRPFSPFEGHNPMSVYLSKVLDAQQPVTEAMERGTWMEPYIVEWAAHALGDAPIVEDPDKLYVVEQDRSGGVMAANLDGLLLKPVDGERAAIEAKFVGMRLADRWGAEEMSDLVPDYVNLQCQHQMACGGLGVIFVAAFIVTPWALERRLFRVPRSQPLIDVMIRTEVDFWSRHVVPKVPPTEFVANVDLLRTIRRLAGKSVDLSSNEKAVAWAMLNQARRDAEKQEIEALAALLGQMGDAEIARFADGSVFTIVEQKGPDIIDREAMRKAGVYGQFARENRYRVPRYKPAKKP